MQGASSGASQRIAQLVRCAGLNNANNANQAELLEDGLQLWLVALRNAPTLAADSGNAAAPLLALFPALVFIMAASTEYIAFGMQVGL